MPRAILTGGVQKLITDRMDKRPLALPQRDTPQTVCLVGEPDKLGTHILEQGLPIGRDAPLGPFGRQGQLLKTNMVAFGIQLIA